MTQRLGRSLAREYILLMRHGPSFGSGSYCAVAPNVTQLGAAPDYLQGLLSLQRRAADLRASGDYTFMKHSGRTGRRSETKKSS